MTIHEMQGKSSKLRPLKQRLVFVGCVILVFGLFAAEAFFSINDICAQTTAANVVPCDVGTLMARAFGINRNACVGLFWVFCGAVCILDLIRVWRRRVQ